MQNILSLAEKFIAIKSTTDHPQALGEILELALSQVSEYTIERFERNGSKSALVYTAKTRPEKFKIILNAHLDVIPGKEQQYIPQIKGDKLYGVGSMDMKANAVCLILVFKELAAQVDYPLGLQLVTDEEIGGFDGTKYQVEEGVRADFIIAGEPTNFDVVNKAKGILKLKIFAPGKTAHGAYPWRGENAIWKMHEFLNALRARYPISEKEVWMTTLNLARIETSNQAFNKIPDDCTISLDIRYIPEDEGKILEDIQKLLPREFVLDVVTKEPALLTDQNNEYIKKLESVTQKIIGKSTVARGAHGTSDARHFSEVGCPGIEFGPIGGGIGSDDEWVDIPSLEKYHQIIKDFLSSINLTDVP